MKKLTACKSFGDILKEILDMDITLKDGTKCKVKENVKSIKFIEKPRKVKKII